MIPLRDNILNYRKPIVIYWLIGINIALFLWELKLDVSGELGNVVTSWGVIPSLFGAAVRDTLSGNPAAGLVVVVRSTSLLVGMFLHSSFSQIVGNLIFLWVFGKSVESLLGHGKFLVFYLASGILTGLVQILVEPSLTVPLIGANGAIASILGAYILLFPKARIDTIIPILIIFITVEIPASFYLFWWFVQQLFYGIGSLNIPGGVNHGGIGYWAHSAGIIIGVALIRLLHRR
ncbi:rhomboid family intramembrane serine protease [Iningainema tapete]|uniref:Rhomboid family intramembrane serine protease n=1 Tax=Iningainema tapete BLCC-T55 TaxID=2748662 RepID=A0A8J6XF14_9CYAN|nr:rhomboid family intramembrane serine protease [Iningainema tapete]MBD2774429.1 rhomboid family intramembrane serine protease [Iningainema tapete BLCC-T55]